MEGFLSHKIGDKEIKFFIGVYSLEKSLEEMDASLSDLGELLNKKFMPLVRHYIYFSAEYHATEIEGIEFEYSPKDAYKWIDAMGGINSEFYLKFSKAVLKDLGVNMDAKAEEPEKKSPKATKTKPIL